MAQNATATAPAPASAPAKTTNGAAQNANPTAPKTEKKARSYSARAPKSVEARLLNSKDLRDYFALPQERRSALEVLLGRTPAPPPTPPVAPAFAQE